MSLYTVVCTDVAISLKAKGTLQPFRTDFGTRCFGPFIVKPFLTVTCSEAKCMGLLVSLFCTVLKRHYFGKRLLPFQRRKMDLVTYFGYMY